MRLKMQNWMVLFPATSHNVVLLKLTIRVKQENRGVAKLCGKSLWYEFLLVFFKSLIRKTRTKLNNKESISVVKITNT